MQHPVHGEFRAGQHADDGLDQEGHVVVDDVDDGAGIAPTGRAVGCGRRVEHADLDLAGCPVLPDPPVPVDDAQHVARGPGLILCRDLPEVGVDQRRTVGSFGGRGRH